MTSELPCASSDAKIRRCVANRATSELEGSAPWLVGGLFVVRGTLRNCQLVSEFGSIFDSRFPASSDRWLTALRDPTAAMPNAPGPLWTDIPGSRLFAARRRSAALPDSIVQRRITSAEVAVDAGGQGHPKWGPPD